MRLLSLYLGNFRNYTEAAFSFSPKINYIYGENAQGKTNLLEAIHLLISGRSFRTPHLQELIQFGKNHFYLELNFEKNGIEQVIKFFFDGKSRKIIHNTTTLHSLSSLLGILHGVILSPEDRQLVKGGPALRRQFLDFQIAQTNPLYLYHLSRFNRAMRQRNHLLRHPTTSHEIAAWEEQMASSAAYITIHRHLAVEELGKDSHPLHNALSSQLDHLELSYRSSAPRTHELDIMTYFMNQFEKHRPREKMIGSTLSGPHRDDLIINLQKQEARSFASEGQQRSCVIALRLAEWARLQKQTQELPIMCLDDVSISLDENREKNLYQQLEHLGQVFLTSPYLETDLPFATQFIEIKGFKEQKPLQSQYSAP